MSNIGIRHYKKLPIGMSRAIWYLLWIFFSLNLVPSFGQNKKYFDNLEYQYFSEELSQNQIVDIIQDFQGYIWVATYDGLNKYNGLQIEIFKRNWDDSTSLPSNQINTLLEDHNQELWIGTQNGLAHFNRNFSRFDIWKADSTKINSLCDNGISCLYEDTAHNLWIGTHSGVCLLSPDRKTFKIIDTSLKDQFVTSIIEDKQGNMLIGTELALYIYDSKTKKTRYLKKGSGKPLKIKNTRKLYKDTQDNIWVATTQGLYLLKNLEKTNFKTQFFVHNPEDSSSLSSNQILDIVEDPSGNIWVSTKKRRATLL